ncbi:hypothetical protein BCF44_101250 [Kutzneria buriramensis]|uniref:Uncharacterized protein n=1 Tax=Kutzneria buriramensis TaxID=1045776 RepID=A0A3E0I911_9PSEU|nr:hypothetical protein BCF44_101250 [Kutzneria buriramensis]
MGFVLFEPEFIDEAITLGRQHAQNLLPLKWIWKLGELPE